MKQRSLFRATVSLLLCTVLMLCPLISQAEDEFLVADEPQAQSETAQTGEGIDPAKEADYASAVQMLEDGSYIDAVNSFAAIGKYRDAVRYTDYGFAMLKLLRNDLIGAMQAFDALGDFYDAPYQKRVCETMAVHRVQLGNAFGYADLNGQVVIPAAYDWAERVFRTGSAVDVVEGDAQSVENSLLPVAAVFQGTVEQTQEGIVPTEGKYGLLRRDGELIVPISYDAVLWTDRGFAALQSGEQTVLVNLLTGQTLGSYDEVGELNEGYIAVRSGEKWGYVDTDGTLLGDGYVWDAALPVSQGLAGVTLDKLAGFVTPEGQVEIALEYQDVKPFSEGMAGVRVKKRWGFVSLNGETVIEPQYADVGQFMHGSCTMKKSGKWGLIDAQNTVLLRCRYDEITEFDPVYHRAWMRNGKLWGLLNPAGEIVLKPTWSSHTSFGVEGVSMVGYRKKFGYIDTMGVVRITPDYSLAAPVSAGLCGVYSDEGIAYLNKFNRVEFTVAGNIPTQAMNGFIEGVTVSEYEETVVDEKERETTETRYRVTLSLYGADGTPIQITQ